MKMTKLMIAALAVGGLLALSPHCARMTPRTHLRARPRREGRRPATADQA